MIPGESETINIGWRYEIFVFKDGKEEALVGVSMSRLELGLG